MHAVHRRGCYVERIDRGLRWQCRRTQQGDGQLLGCWRGAQHRNATGGRDAAGGSVSIPAANFGEHGFGHKQLECFPSGPPLDGDLLARCADQVTARQRGQVAQHGRLQIDPWSRWRRARHGACSRNRLALDAASAGTDPSKWRASFRRQVRYDAQSTLRAVLRHRPQLARESSRTSA